ncbi:MAG: alpha/beta hydrolase [Granulosicoccus sp.]|nr:alpha/beta hydrolase [Granulosicoccus sp.]
MNSFDHPRRYVTDRLTVRPGLLLLLGSTVLAACSVLKPVNLLNALVPSSGYTLASDIAYGLDERQKMDIYFPTKPAPESRVIVFVYGGAWREGNRSEYKFVGQALADAGHVVLIPDYRLYPSVIFPEFLRDIADAIAALKLSFAQRSGDSIDQVVLMGHSSGAHTVAMLASDPRWLDSSGITPAALIAIAGPYDLPLDDPEVEPVFRSVSGFDEARPVALVTSEHPPALLVHGDKDKRVKPFHTRHYAAALTAARVPVKVHWLKETRHAASISGLAAPLDSSSENRDRITGFLEGL